MLFRNKDKEKPQGASVRLASYTVLGVVATVFSSSVFPPVFTSQTNRALINAPVIPLTTPISGVVKISGNGRAAVENDKVDNTTLIGLKVQLAALDNELRQKNAIIGDYASRIDNLNNDLLSQQAALLQRTESDLEAAKAALQMVTYSTRIAKAEAVRKQKLVAKGVYFGIGDDIADTIQLEDTKLQAAKVAVDKLNKEMSFARQGIYIGSDLQSLQNLQQEIRTRSADLLQIQMQMTTMQTRKSELEALASAEAARIDRLTRADLAIPPGTTLYKPVAVTGREVVAGDTLAEALDCRNAFVVAIFSERQAQALSVGSRVKVNADAWAQEADGVVERLVPRTTERVDLDYAVPFPPTERRELYAYIRMAGTSESQFMNNGVCSVGTWGSVSLPREWLGKTREYVHEASASLFQFAQASASEMPDVRQAAWTLIETSREKIFEQMGMGGQQQQPPGIAAPNTKPDIITQHAISGADATAKAPRTQS